MSEPMPSAGPTRATAHLPGLKVEITHRLSPDREVEQLSVNLEAMPSFDAFGRWLEAMNPFAFWMQTTRMLWFPWLDMSQAMLPSRSAPQLWQSGAGPDERP